MSSPVGGSFLAHPAALSDPRQSWKVIHPVIEALPTVLSCATAGAEDLAEIRRWAVLRMGFLRRLLPCAKGVSSHDTPDDIMNATDAELFAARSTRWVASPAG